VYTDGLAVTVLVATTAPLATLLTRADVPATALAADVAAADVAAAVEDEAAAEDAAATTDEVTDAPPAALLVATRLVLMTTGPGPSGTLINGDGAAVAEDAP